MTGNINIQPMGDIQKSGEKKKKERPSDPIQAEFEDGKDFLAKKEYSQALLAFHNTLKAWEEKNDQDGIANASNQLGLVCLEKEEYEKAREHFNRSWEICKRFDDTMSILALSGQFVVIHRALGEYDKALSLCLDMLDTHSHNTNPQGTVEVLEVMGEVYLEKGDREKAADCFRTISSIHANFSHETSSRKFAERAAELEAS